MKKWKILMVISLEETELLNHDHQGDFDDYFIGGG